MNTIRKSMMCLLITAVFIVPVSALENNTGNIEKEFNSEILSDEHATATNAVEWVIMIYLNGDNNLSAFQGQLLEKIRQVGSSNQVKIVLFIDQNQVGDTRLYYLDGTTLVQQTWPTESSMDDPATIVQLVTKVKNDLPANHYALFISTNKGSGWQGVSGTTMGEAK